jgi:hypothetical protein
VIFRSRAGLVAACALALGTPAPTLAAQRLRGQVFLPDSATPARGVIVVATGENGALVRRALTNPRGNFELSLPRSGRFVVSVLRIGFRPTIVPSLDLAADETRSLRIVLGGNAIALAKVTVRGREVCRTRPDSGLLVARVWEEARKALMASQLSADQPLFAEWIEFDRSLDASGTRVREQRVRTTRSPTTHAFKSWPADSLAAAGYIVADTEATTFYAPDADVLLSESFASLHCFRVEPPPADRADLIGVGFRPARDKRDLKDIEGTLWLDRATAELKWLEYRYTNVPATAERAGAGGRVEFLRLASGEWLVSRWNIRMPQLGAPERIADAGTRRVILAAPDAWLRAVHVTGGEVTSVSRGDSLLFRAAGAAFTVQFVSHDTLVPVAGATVTLLGTDYEAKADASGRAQIVPVLEGRYRVRVETPLMEAIGASRLEREVEIREGVARVDSIALPVAGEFLRLACGNDAVKPVRVALPSRIIFIAPLEALLYGTVRDSLGRAAPHAAVTVSWQGRLKSLGGGEMAVTTQTRGVLTDELGRWHLCGMPLQTPIAVRTVTDAGVDQRKTRVEEDVPLSSLDLMLRRLATVSEQADAHAGVVLEISVSDRSGTPLPDVTLDLTPQNGPARKLVASEQGRALLVDLEPGVVRVRARSVGFKAGELAVSVEAGRNTIPIILDRVRLPSLDTVRVMGDRRVLARHDEFEMRLLRREATASITSQEIEKRHPTSTWQMLTSVAAIDVADRFENGQFVVVATSRRAMMSEMLSSQPCFLRVMVDGVMLPADDAQGRTNLSYLPPPSSIHGIEVFAGGASIPLQYTGAGAAKWCGLIAVWTK